MPDSGTGVFARLYSWVTDKANGVKIIAQRVDNEMDGMGAALTNRICRDGQTTTAARIPFAQGISVASGSAGAPAVAGVSDADTGVFFPADNAVALAAGASTLLSASKSSDTTQPNLIETTGNLSVRSSTNGNQLFRISEAIAPTVAVPAGVPDTIACSGVLSVASDATVAGVVTGGYLSSVGGMTVGTDITFSTSGATTGRLLWQGGNVGITVPFGNHILFVTSGLAAWYVDNARKMKPALDNAYSLGDGAYRTSTVYSGTGSINTSDAREKTLRDGVAVGLDYLVSPFTASEIAAAKDLAREIGLYKWRDSVAGKGVDARLHVGLTVQRSIEIMQGYGLDPLRYGFICHDVWSASSGIAAEEDAVEIPARAAGERYSFRSDQLALFIARGQEARLAVLEAR